MSARSAGATAAPADAVAAGATGAVEQRMARIHLRLGSLLLARAELEQLAAGERLDVIGLADLAEVRWRTGDLDLAATAAASHLAAGGVEPVARVIAAEAAAAAGRPAEARAHVTALGGLPPAELERHFAGMPRRAFWPSAAAAVPEALEASGSGRGRASRRDGPAGGGPAAAAVPSDEPPELGLWPDDEGTAGTGAAPADRATDGPPATADPTALLARGRADIRSGEVDRVVVGLERLGIALRLDSTLAPGVLEALGRRREPGALMLRGDACRILGRVLEAEAAYVAAAAALDALAGRGSS